jgi:endonuclease/exonuclease/phosphatase family metal-dependent hydrolase
MLMPRLVTYNLYKGGPADYCALGRALSELDPDVLLTQEMSAPHLYRKGMSAPYRERLHDIRWCQADTNYWGSAIYTKYGVVSYLEVPNELRGWVTAAEVSGMPDFPGTGTVRIISVHTPTRKKSNYITEAQGVIDALKHLVVGHDTIVGGDFNITISRRQGETLDYKAEQELEVLERIEGELGLINCWQSLHPEQALPQTYQHQFQATSAPRHLDGIFVPANWLPYLQHCEVLNSGAWVGRSDHFPVMASISA